PAFSVSRTACLRARSWTVVPVPLGGLSNWEYQARASMPCEGSRPLRIATGITSEGRVPLPSREALRFTGCHLRPGPPRAGLSSNGDGLTRIQLLDEVLYPSGVQQPVDVRLQPTRAAQGRRYLLCVQDGADLPVAKLALA